MARISSSLAKAVNAHPNSRFTSITCDCSVMSVGHSQFGLSRVESRRTGPLLLLPRFRRTPPPAAVASLADPPRGPVRYCGLGDHAFHRPGRKPTFRVAIRLLQQHGHGGHQLVGPSGSSRPASFSTGARHNGQPGAGPRTPAPAACLVHRRAFPHFRDFMTGQPGAGPLNDARSARPFAEASGMNCEAGGHLLLPHRSHDSSLHHVPGTLPGKAWTQVQPPHMPTGNKSLQML